jgi:hypothetical protein
MRIWLILVAAMMCCAGVEAQTAHPTPIPATTPTLKFAYGQWWNGCGPVDEPTSGITLTTARLSCNFKKLPTPRINVQLSYHGDKSAPVAVEGANYEGPTPAQAGRCLKDDAPCEPAIGGTIRLGGPKATYDLKFADGSVEKGTFVLKSCSKKIMCS